MTAPGSEQDTDAQGYPPETHRYMSWAAINFIHRPSWRPLAWVVYLLLGLMLAGAVTVGMVGLTIRVPGAGEVVADPGVLQVLAHADGLMSRPRVQPGSEVKKGEILAVLQMEIEEKQLEQIRAKLLRNVSLLENVSRQSGLSPELEEGDSLAPVNHSGIRTDTALLRIVMGRLRKSFEQRLPYESYRNEAIRVSTLLRSSLAGYMEDRRIRASGPGRVLQYEVKSDENVKAGGAVAILLPEGARLVVKIIVEPRYIANVELRQKVQHKLEAYPFQRYGIFGGEVLSVTQSPQSDGTLLYEVLATVEVPEELPLRLKKTVRLVRGMTVQSDILTGEKLIWDLLMDSIFGNA